MNSSRIEDYSYSQYYPPTEERAGSRVYYNAHLSTQKTHRAREHDINEKSAGEAAVAAASTSRRGGAAGAVSRGLLREAAFAEHSVLSSPEMSGEGAVVAGPAGGLGDNLLEVVLPMSTRLHPTKDVAVSHPLGLCVCLARGGGPRGTALRTILIRVTDPEDPFLLFELVLHEEDYAGFKTKLELLVDFSGFPRFLANLIQSIADGSSGFQLSFTVHTQDPTRATLRVVELTPFKTIEHLAFVLVRQGDAGQKAYLAERFRWFEHAFLQLQRERDSELVETQRRTQELRRRLDDVSAENHRLMEELRLQGAQAEQEKRASLSDIRETEFRERAELRTTYETKLSAAEAKVTGLEERLRAETAQHTESVAELQRRYEIAEAARGSLDARVRELQTTNEAQARELDSLKDTCEGLREYHAQASKVISENEVNYVALSERLRAALDALQAKDDELQTTKSHVQQQEDCLHVLTEQNKQATGELRRVEKSLQKANYIIGNQLQTIQNTKERLKMAREQLRTQQALLDEREQHATRVQTELATTQAQLSDLQAKTTALREQLRRTDEIREKLQEELQQARMALLHLQCNAAPGGLRRGWGAHSLSAKPPSASLSPGLTTAHSGSSWRPGPSLEPAREGGRDHPARPPSRAHPDAFSVPQEGTTTQLPLFTAAAGLPTTPARDYLGELGVNVAGVVRKGVGDGRGSAVEREPGLAHPNAPSTETKSSRRQLQQKSFLATKEVTTEEGVVKAPVSAYF